MPVRELLERLDSNELSEWLAYDSAYGLPDGYFLTGQICATLVSLLSKEKGRPSDFVPYFQPQARKQTVADHRSAMRSVAARMARN